jgi:GrpB-like predicted nucleotidyltransferase (UPF0157 family)
MVPLPIPALLVPYDPEWPNLAKMHSARLSVLGSVLVIVHHIGSTSVPGLAAKPIIELMPLVTSLSDLDRERSRIETLGYGSVILTVHDGRIVEAQKTERIRRRAVREKF